MKNVEKADYLKRKGILVLKRQNEKKEIEFELNHLLSLSIEERISLMEANRKRKHLLESKPH